MDNAKRYLKILGLLFVLPAVFVGVCLMAIRPLDVHCDEVGFIAVSILGDVWIPWEQIPSGKVVTVDTDLHYIHTEDPVEEAAVREAAAEEAEKIADTRYSVQIAELEKQIDEINMELEETKASLEERKAERAAAERRAEQQKSDADRAGRQAVQEAERNSNGSDAEKNQSAVSPESAPATSVDAAALIANGHAYASSKNMGVNDALSTGNAGYFSPVDISILSQESAQNDIYYCIDQIAGMMGTLEQNHPPVYNIVQVGNRIYILYG